MNFKNVSDALMSCEYSDNTKKNLLCELIKHVQENEIDLYKSLINEFRLKIDTNYQIAAAFRRIPSLNQFRHLLVETYPKEDYRLLLGLLYCWWPVRDDFNLVINSITDNSLDIQDGEYFITIRKSKRIQEELKRLIPEELVELIKQHIERNDLKDGDYLFGKSKLSPVIRRMFRKMGFDKGSINTIRRMHRNEAIRSKDHNLIKLTAKNSLHSVTTAQLYNTVI
ncbi:hypothetical protein EBZ38_06770 [bacterium]|nr:hypothetical protein [bacterium]